jgi:hypothetical protein
MTGAPSDRSLSTTAAISTIHAALSFSDSHLRDCPAIATAVALVVTPALSAIAPGPLPIAVSTAAIGVVLIPAFPAISSILMIHTHTS